MFSYFCVSDSRSQPLLAKDEKYEVTGEEKEENVLDIPTEETSDGDEEFSGSKLLLDTYSEKEEHEPEIPTEKDEEIAEIVREVRDRPPANFLWKIENFSQLSKVEAPYFESNGFLVDNEYTWKLRLYLHSIGNKKLSNGNGHISLYVALSSPTSLPFYHKARATVKLFVYDQIRDNYLTVKDSKARHILGTETELGFNELLPHKVFNDASNGYLINDSCIFGCEVNVMDIYKTKVFSSTCLSKELGDKNSTYTWKIKNFKKMKDCYYESKNFIIGGRIWSMFVRQNWNEPKKRGNLSLAIDMKDSENLYCGERPKVGFVVLIKDQIHGKDHKQYGVKCFSYSSDVRLEFKDFIPLSKLNDESKGFICNGDVTFEVRISYIAIY